MVDADGADNHHRRRPKKPTRAGSALERLKQQREAGKSSLAAYQVDEQDHRIFDEVDELDYQILVRKRLQEDDFVVDDDGLGYVDYGAGDWNEARESGTDASSDDEGNAQSQAAKKEAKRKRQEDKAASKHGKNIGAMMLKQQKLQNVAKAKGIQAVGPVAAADSSQPTKRPSTNTALEEDGSTLEAMFSEIDHETDRIERSSRQVKKKKTLDAALYGPTAQLSKKPGAIPSMRKNPFTVQLQEPRGPAEVLEEIIPEPMDFGFDEDLGALPETAAEDTPAGSVAAEQQTSNNVVLPAPVSEEQEEIATAVPQLKVLQPKFKANANKPLQAKCPIVPLNPITSTASSFSDSTTMQKQQGTFVAPLPSVSEDVQAVQTPMVSLKNEQDLKCSLLEDDGSMLMYWLDAYEGKDGIVYLFGKVWHRGNNAFVSCCVTVTGSERTLYFLPRARQLDVTGHATDTAVDLEMCWNEIDSIMTKHKISSWGLKEVQKKYAFEVPDLPMEADWLEVTYPFANTILSKDLKGSTFSHVFGTSTSALEFLLLKANLMGPCWIVLREPKMASQNISWCRVEMTMKLCTEDQDRLAADDGLNIKVLTDADLDTKAYPEHCRSAPPLVALSFSMKTVMNYKKNVNEIAAASAIVYHHVSVDGATSEDARKKSSYYRAVRPLCNGVFPMGFSEAAKQQGIKVEMTQNERGLLNFLIAILHRVDPDIIVGHNFLGFDLDVLLHRMRDLRVEHWSRLGRLRRNQFPKLQAGVGGMGDSTYSERMVTSGRLICDSYIAAKDLIKSTSYSLAQLSKNVLKADRPALELERIPQYFEHSSDLIWLIRHCENDAYLSMGLVFQLMAIPLSKQLTNLAGNLWSRTLTGGRAERNEYLLLHEFYKNGYVLPDKSFGDAKGSGHATAADKGGKGKKNIKEAAKKKASTGTITSPAEEKPEVSGELDDDDEETGVDNKRVGRRKPAYLGGLVLEPKKGLYDKFVLMLDFNSLYPSIIREYNICFTTVERKLVMGSSPDTVVGEEEIPELPDPSLEQGILPRLLATLVERRRQVKGLMKTVDSKSSEYAQLNIRQQALKLTANSMYGCLGFTMSRFYAKPLAMLITSKGRQILQDTVNVAEQTLNLDVIYGDTDSIMIYTNTDNLAEVKSMGAKLKQAVNKKYKLLEIEMDGFFRRMLLLKKKKYAALTATEGENGTLILNREIKGLDLVRRDWCGLSKEVSEYVLEQILSDLDREDVLNNIHTYLQKVGEDARASRVPIEKFVINKGLTRAPEEYADAKSQPHVQVALGLKAKGQSARAGDTIPYVICEDEDKTKPFAMRARHPEDLSKPELNLKIDVDYYLNIQIHPPVSRLCQPIEGTDSARIAECLGLDPSKFRSVSYGDRHEDKSMETFESQVSDQERFKDCDRLMFTCSECSECFNYEGVVRKEDDDYVCGLTCSKCNKLPNIHGLSVQVTLAIRRHISRYYEGWLVCDDATCRNRTRQVSVYGNHCIVPNCRGTMRHEYSDNDLYTQLIFFGVIFDVQRHLMKMGKSDDKEHVTSVLAPHSVLFQKLNAAVKQYLNKNARGYVDLGKLFQFCKLSTKSESSILSALR